MVVINSMAWFWIVSENRFKNVWGRLFKILMNVKKVDVFVLKKKN